MDTMVAADALSVISIDDLVWAAPKFHNNLSILSPQKEELAKLLLVLNQEQLFHRWPRLGIKDDQKHSFFVQVSQLNGSYPGGLAYYIKSARKNSKHGGFSSLVPSGESEILGDDDSKHYENAGMHEARKVAFVLATWTCFLELYIKSILAWQEELLAKGLLMKSFL